MPNLIKHFKIEEEDPTSVESPPSPQMKFLNYVLNNYIRVASHHWFSKSELEEKLLEDLQKKINGETQESSSGEGNANQLLREQNEQENPQVDY